MRNLATTILCFIIIQTYAIAQCSGGDPSANYDNWNYNISIEDNYNNARRAEETDLGLPANCLGDLTAPPGGWASLSDEAIALYIHNAEREARGKLPFYDVENHLSAVAQAHSDWQINNKVFNHAGDPTIGTDVNFKYEVCPNCGTRIIGSSPFQRMNENTPLQGQWERESENLATAATTGTSLPNFVASSIYGFMYVDIIHSWGHRHNVLATYNNNWGDSQNEGFIGVGVTTGTNYQSCAYSCNTYYAKILTVDYYDPQAGATGYSFSALPMELLSFDAEENDGNVYISWSTATEKNSHYFEIQRSDDRKEFETIASVDAAGNSIKQLDYFTVDYHPKGGIQYYRLRSIDLDGNSEYSEIVSVFISSNISVSLSPNPFADQIRIQSNIALQNGTIKVMGINGLVVKEFEINTLTTSRLLDMHDLDSGLYFIHISANGIEETFKILKI